MTNLRCCPIPLARESRRRPMKSLADALPPEIAERIDPEWRMNEAAYWSVRDQLLER